MPYIHSFACLPLKTALHSDFTPWRLLLFFSMVFYMNKTRDQKSLFTQQAVLCFALLQQPPFGFCERLTITTRAGRPAACSSRSEVACDLLLRLAALPALKNAVCCDFGKRCAHLSVRKVNTKDTAFEGFIWLQLVAFVVFVAARSMISLMSLW